MYLELMGKATVSDQCTTVGPILTNPIITLPPGGLSTLRPEASDNYWNNNEPNDYDPFAVGEVWSDPSGDDQGILQQDVKPLNIQDLECPTWGLGLSTPANGDIITTIGPPWLPLIVPPMEMFSLDPTWVSECTGFWSDFFTLTTFALFDPPIALTPEALLVPTSPAGPKPTPAPTPASPTKTPEQTIPSTEAAKPGSLPNDPAAAPTKPGDPGRESPTSLPVIPSAGSASLPDDPAAADSPNNESDPPSDPPSDPKAVSPAGNPPTNPTAPSSDASDPPPSDSQSSPTDPQLPVVLVPQGEDPQKQTQGLGAIIYNAFGKSGSEVDGSSSVLLPPQSIFTIGAQTFTANPKGFNVDNAVISPGGPAQTVDGTKISLNPSGILAIGSSTIPLTDPPATPVLAVAGQTFTPNPSAFSVAGSVISAGGPAVTISGTVISLGQSGALAIGSSTIDLSSPSDPDPASPSDLDPSKVYTVAGQTFTPNPSAFSIAGTTISADGTVATISGTIVSLGPDGILKIGSSIVPLPTPADAFPSNIYTVAGQTFTPNPSGFSIAGTTVSAGGPAVTVGGTIVSLGQSGALAIGSSTINLPTLSSTPSKVYTVAGQVFTPNPSAFAIAGTTVSAGGPAVTVGGTIVSLQPSGTLIVGSSTIPLLTPQATFSSDVQIDEFDVEAESSFAVVDGVTLSAAASGVTISGKVVSLEAGGAMLDIGTGRFALPTPTGAGNGSIDVQAFVGGQGKGFELPLIWVCSVSGGLMLFL